MQEEIELTRIPPFPSRQMVIAAANMLKAEGHSGFEALRLEFGLDNTEAGTGSSLQERANTLAKYALEDPERRTPQGIGLQSAIVARAGEHYRSGTRNNIGDKERNAFKAASAVGGRLNDVTKSGTTVVLTNDDGIVSTAADPSYIGEGKRMGMGTPAQQRLTGIFFDPFFNWDDDEKLRLWLRDQNPDDLEQFLDWFNFQHHEDRLTLGRQELRRLRAAGTGPATPITTPAPPEQAKSGISAAGRAARFARWDQLGVDRVKSDLLNGGHQLVGGPPEVRELAWEWVRLRENGGPVAATPGPQKPPEMITLKPTLWGFSIDLKEVGRRASKWWRSRNHE